MVKRFNFVFGRGDHFEFLLAISFCKFVMLLLVTTIYCYQYTRTCTSPVAKLGVQALLGEWCALVNECRAVPTEAGKTGLSAPKREPGRRAQDETQDSGPKSLLDDVEQDAFLPG